MKAIYQTVLSLLHTDVRDGAATIAFFCSMALIPATFVFITLIDQLELNKTLDTSAPWLTQWAPQETQTLFAEVKNLGSRGHLSALGWVGLLIAFIATTNGIGAIIRQLNRVKACPENRGPLTRRATYLIIFLAINGVIFSSAILFLLWPLVVEPFTSYLGEFGYQAVAILKNITGLLLITFIFSFMYWVGPSQPTNFARCLRGGFWGTLVFLIGSVLLGSLLSEEALTTGWGRSHLLIALLAWFYLLGYSFLAGAHLTKN